MVSGMVIPLIAWCIKTKGPLYVTMFSPIRLVIVALAGSFALEETLHLGRYTQIMHVFHQTNVLCMIYIVCKFHSLFILRNVQYNWCYDNGGRCIPSYMV